VRGGRDGRTRYFRYLVKQQGRSWTVKYITTVHNYICNRARGSIQRSRKGVLPSAVISILRASWYQSGCQEYSTQLTLYLHSGYAQTRLGKRRGVGGVGCVGCPRVCVGVVWWWL